MVVRGDGKGKSRRSGAIGPGCGPEESECSRIHRYSGLGLLQKGSSRGGCRAACKAVLINEQEARIANIPPAANYHYHLGMALKGKGDREESRRELEAAIRLADKSPFPDLEEAKKALASL